ncbi:CRE-MLTN-13 protein [Ditylenchus destructor]|nr:CRE-MLTN-13 protein [Ditylenchus destructor]
MSALSSELIEKNSLNDLFSKFETDSAKYAFNPAKVDAFFRRAAIMALLKAKAKVLLVDLPHVEQVIYKNCAANAKRPVELSKCLIKLLKNRPTSDPKIILPRPPKSHLFKRNNRNNAANPFGNFKVSSEEDLSLLGEWKGLITKFANSVAALLPRENYTKIEATATIRVISSPAEAVKNSKQNNNAGKSLAEKETKFAVKGQTDFDYKLMSRPYASLAKPSRRRKRIALEEKSE